MQFQRDQKKWIFPAFDIEFFLVGRKAFKNDELYLHDLLGEIE
jgi:hypothetical protein